ncbi:hypothetical protein ACFQZC_34985 [Streptacidiphilus monticola]
MAAARKDLFRLHPNLADRQQVRWGVQLLDGDGEPVSVVMAERWADRGEQHRAAVDAADQVRLLHFKRSPHGYLQIVEQPAQPVFDKAVALPAEECFALEGSFPCPAVTSWSWCCGTATTRRRTRIRRRRSTDGSS